MATWAGWTGPDCEISVDGTDILLGLVATDGRPTAGMQIFISQNMITGSYSIFNDLGFIERSDNLTEPEIGSCLADLNGLAIALGLLDGCSTD